MLHFPEDLPRPERRDPEIRKDRHQRLDRRLRPGLLRYPGLQFPRALRERVDVEYGGKPPLASIDVKEAVVAQMVIDVVDEDREGDASPKFLGVGPRRSAVRPQRILSLIHI